MAITTVDKIKINKYLKEHSVEEIYYNELCESLSKKEKITHMEFLEYFTDCVINEFNKNEKISIKYISKIVFLVQCFMNWIKKSDEKIKEETLFKIVGFKEFYSEYLQRNELEIDQEFNDKYLKVVVRMANKLIPTESKKEQTTHYINKVKELEDEIKELKRQLETLTKEHKKLSSSYERKIKKNDELSDKIDMLEKDIEVKIEEIDRLSKEIEDLKNKTIDLETSLSLMKDEKELLSKYKTLYEQLIIDFDALKKSIEEAEKKQKQEEELKERETHIEEIIYQKLLFEGLTIEELIKHIKLQGYISTKEEVSALLKNIKSKINIENNIFSTSPIYKVIQPQIKENNQFIIDIPNNCKHYDIMLVSDFHIRNIDSKVLSGFDLLNNYCINNNINLILNLGDFYDGIGGRTLEYANAMKNYQLIEESIMKLPKSDSVYHAILGGNHDRNISIYGYDPIKVFTEERTDFINLGYTHSTISLNSKNETLGVFDIHHPDIFDFKVELDDDGMNCLGLEKYLKKLYESQKRSRETSYIDIFGHTHKSQFNYLNSYCYLPSFLEGQQKRGACHLRIYFDDNKQIKYMVFMPLSFSNQLIKNNEIIYKKTLTK